MPLLPAVLQGEWEALGSNGAGNGALNTTVNAVAIMGGNVYVGGYFQNLNNNGTVLETADYIAKWDGGSWSALGSNGGGNGALTGVVFALAVMGTDLYVGGQFADISNNGTLLLEADKIAKWDGSNWSALGSNGAGNGALVNGGDVNALVVIGSDLYVGGGFLNAGGNPVADRIAKWNGSTWSPLGSTAAFDDTVYTLAAIGSDLYVGGAFSNVDNGGTLIPEADRIAKWDGSNWSAVSSNGAGNGSLSGSVFALAAIGSNLFVGGEFTNVNDNGSVLGAADFIAKWDGSNWSALGSNGGGDGALNARVSALAPMGAELFVGGAFLDAGNNGAADRIARWDGSNWLALGSNGAGGGSVTSDVWGLAITGDDIYVGGQFGDVNNNGTGLPAADYIAVYKREASTPTPTFTPSNTLTPSDTPTASLTPSNTPSPTFTTQPPAENLWTALGGAGSELNGTVQDIQLVNGVIYAGGYFTNAGGDANADFIAKFSGGVWSSLGGPGSGLNAAVENIEVIGGEVYAGGSFTNAGGDSNADYIAKFSGGTWSSLGGVGLNFTVYEIEVDGGVVYAGGGFTNAGGDSNADYIAKFNGSTWSALGGANSGLNNNVYAILIDAGTIYAGGIFTNAGLDANANFIAQFSGGAWSALGSGLVGAVLSIEMSGGVIYVGGGFVNAGGDANADYIARFSSGVWSSLGGTGSGLADTVWAVKAYSGSIYALGDFINAGGDPNADRIARFSSAVWSSLAASGSGLPGSGRVLLIESDVIYVGGSFVNAGGDANADYIAKFGIGPIPTPTATWTPSPTLTPSNTPTPTQTFTTVPAISGQWAAVGGASSVLNSTVYSILLDSGLVYAGGQYTNASGNAVADYVAKFVGGTWYPLGSGLGLSQSGSVYSLAKDGSDIYVGGFFYDVAGNPNSDMLAKFNGASWSTVCSGLGGINGFGIHAIVIDGANVYLGGSFLNADGNPNEDNIAVYNGSTCSSLGSGLNGSVSTIQIDGGIIYAGGGFTNAGGDTDADYIAKYSGGVWSSLGGPGTGLNSTVSTIQVVGGDVYAAGSFTNAGADPEADYIAKFSGGQWSDVGPGAAPLSSFVEDFVIYNGIIYAGGSFGDAGGHLDADSVAQYTGYGWFPLSGSGGSGLNSTVMEIEISADVLYAGGQFIDAGGNSNADKIAMFGLLDAPTLTPTPTLTPSLTPTFTPTLPVSGNPSFPSGSTTDRTPVFTWAQVSGATQYRYQVYKGATLLYTKTVTTPVCANSRCTDEPATSLTNGEYKWHVQAMVAGVFGPYGPDLGFWVIPPAVSYDFGTSSAGWAAIDAPWSLSGGFFTSLGNSNEYNSVYQFDNYETLTFEVRAERESSDPFWALNYVFFRGKPNLADPDGDWTDGYQFFWANDQTFYLGYYKNNLFYQLIDWTPSSAISTQANTVKVSATGTTLMLSINGTLLVYGTQPALSSGQVGIGFYRHPSTSGDILNIDWASLKPVGRGFIDAGAETDGAINIDLVQPVLVEDGGPITSDRAVQEPAAASSTPTLPADPAAPSSTGEGLPDASETPAKNTPAINMPATQTPQPTFTATIQQLALAEPAPTKRIRNPHGSMAPK